YAKSFDADGLGTAKVLLEWRDELVLAGWNFELQSNTPPRLACLAGVEHQRDAITKILDRGFADKVSEIMLELEDLSGIFQSITLKEPLAFLPKYLQHIFKVLSENDPLFHAPSRPKQSSNSIDPGLDLEAFQQVLQSVNQTKRFQAKGDGSLILFQCDRDTDAAIFLAKLLQQNPEFRPLVYLPTKTRTLDHACIQEGLPSMGIQTESFARPTLQLLKLVGAFLWKPIDPFKIMEFVSMSIQPIWEELARLIAETLAERPGTGGEFWRSRIAQFFADLETRKASGENIDLVAVRNEYQFWFGRQAYPAGTAIPRAEIIEVFERLANWARNAYDSGGAIQRSLKSLENQARKIGQLIIALPEGESAIDELRLERIVRTIYEAAPVTFVEAQAHHLPYVHKSGAILEPLDAILWWNFTDQDTDTQLPRWYQQELRYLEACGIQMDAQQQKNDLAIWQRQVPVHQALKQLILVMPAQIAGEAQHPHPLFGDFQACFENWKDLVIEGFPQAAHPLLGMMNWPDWTTFKFEPKSEVETFLRLPADETLSFREQESFSSLDALFYFPYQWALKFKTKIRKSPVLSLIREETLKGNLAHRLFERLFKNEEAIQWADAEIDAFIDQNFEPLLEEEGLLLMLYGKEPDREEFRIHLTRAIHTLLAMIRKNGWSVEGVEVANTLDFKGLTVKGIADLVLTRGNEKAVVDLKWRGRSHYRDRIASQEDLQLAFYAKMVGQEQWAHTAYFIIKDALMISRNQQGFQEAQAIDPDSDHVQVYTSLWEKMEKTFDWRLQQLQEGKIELRTENTDHLLDAFYEDLPWEALLAMKTDGARFDDYKALVDRI
ncbi:MAG: PD-(D/E)XK nuclease family protein, partial [Bacteroidota bacterium]